MADDDDLLDTRLSQCEWVRRWLLVVILGVLQLTWAVMMGLAAIFKIVEYGFYQYIRHYTNWSWTLQALFYFATMGAPFILVGLVSPYGPIGRFTRAVIVLGFLPLNGIVWSVLVLVSVLLGTKSPFLTDVFAQLDPAIVMLGNDLYHFWPTVVILIYYIVYNKVIHFAINALYAHQRLLESAFRLVVFIAYEAFLGTAISLVTYGLIFDPHEVYKSNLSTAEGATVVLITLCSVNLVPLLIVVAIYNVGTRMAYPYEWLFINEKDAETYTKMHSGSIKNI